jgi:translation initiation factor IF-2
LLDEHLQRTPEAGPSVPVQVLGLGGVPQAGDTFVVTPSEREARDISSKRQQVKREQDFRRIRSVTLTDLHDQIQEGKIKELNVIVKGDVDGSVEAINQELGAILHQEVRIVVIHSGVGPISESDVLLASASNAIIIGFRVQPESSARALATRYAVDIHYYEIIYEVVEELRAALAGLLSPEVQERIAGVLQVRQVFSSSRMGTVAGCMVQKGKISRNSRVRVRRGNAVVFNGGIASLRRFKDDVREVAEGYECGVGVEGFDDIKVEDLIEVIEVVESARAL